MPKKGVDIDYITVNPQAMPRIRTEIQNYVDKHDNQTLFDNLACAEADLVPDAGVSLATAMPVRGSTAGVELLRPFHGAGQL